MTAALAIFDDPEAPVTYSVTEVQLAAEAARCASLTFDSPSAYEEGRLAIAGLRGTRTAIEERRVSLKAGILARGRKIDAVAKDLTARIEAIEEPLRTAKKLVDDEAARVKAEKEAAKRAEVEAKVRAEQEAAAALRREEQAKEDERLAAIAEAQAVEANRLAMERKKIEDARKAEEKRVAAEREKLAADARAQQKRLDDEKAEQDAKLAAERARLEARSRELDAAKEAADRAEFQRKAMEAAEIEARARVERERVATEAEKIKREADAARERERVEALKPDAEKVMAFAARIAVLANITDTEMPLSTLEAQNEVEMVCQELGELVSRLEESALSWVRGLPDAGV